MSQNPPEIIVGERVEPMHTPATIAKYFGITVSLVRSMRRTGRIPPPDLQIKNRPRWRHETIEALVEMGSL